MPTSNTIRGRVRSLTRKLTASPTLPLLGWTKCVETLVAAGPTLRWAAYAGVVTLLWTVADQLAEAAEDVADDIND